MKILVVTQYFYPETFRINTLCKELVKRGNDITVLTGYPQYPYGKIYDGFGFNKTYQKVWNGVKIERIKMLPRGKTPIGLLMNCYTFVREANKWIEKCNTKYDAVYVFEVSPITVGLPAITYKNKFNVPMIFNVQDLWPENVEVILNIHNKLLIKAINNIVDKIYTNSDRILCSSHSFVQNIKCRDVPENKLVFWPQFCTTSGIDKLEKPKCYDDNCFNIVFAGNIGNAQGLDLMVDVAWKLKNENIKWYIVGDGRMKESLMQQVRRNQVTDKVIFIGKVSEQEANAYVKFADCSYLSFSDNKLFDMTIPAKLQTYLACGTPILGAVGGESADIINASHGGVVTGRTVDSVCEGINKIKNLSHEQVQQIRKNNKYYFENNFNIDMLIDELEEIIKYNINLYKNGSEICAK